MIALLFAAAALRISVPYALAAMGSKRWTRGASQGGMATWDCKSLADALELAGKVAAGKAA